MKFPAAPILLASLGVAAVVLAGCSDDATQRTEAHYCTEVGNHISDLNAPVVATQADIDRVLKSWRTVSGSAPLAIQPEWEVVVNNVETASTVDPADPASLQKVADTARASEQASNRVIAYTMARCGAQIGTPPAAP